MALHITNRSGKQQMFFTVNFDRIMELVGNGVLIFDRVDCIIRDTGDCFSVGARKTTGSKYIVYEDVYSKSLMIAQKVKIDSSNFAVKVTEANEMQRKEISSCVRMSMLSLGSEQFMQGENR